MKLNPAVVAARLLLFLSIGLILAEEDGGGASLSNSTDCISTAEDVASLIYDVETTLAYDSNNGSVGIGVGYDLRTYVLCPNSVIELSGRGREAIRIENGNARILCGEDGRRENNCVIKSAKISDDATGDERWNGAQVLFAAPNANERPWANRTISNVLISGVTIQGSYSEHQNFHYGLVVGGGSLSTDEQGIVFRDCVFENSEADRIVAFWKVRSENSMPIHVRFEGCTFRNNTVKREILRMMTSKHWTLEEKSTMTITNCDFYNNDLRRPGYSNNDGALVIVRNGKVLIADTICRGNTGGRALIKNEPSAGSLGSGEINISNVTFNDNDGISNIVVNSGGLMNLSNCLFGNNTIGDAIRPWDDEALISSYGNIETTKTEIASTLSEHNEYLTSSETTCNGHLFWFRDEDFNYVTCGCTMFSRTFAPSPAPNAIGWQRKASNSAATSPVAVSSTIPIPCPTRRPTPAPTPKPTYLPTDLPTDSPTDLPTDLPTAAPTDVPSAVPSSRASATRGVNFIMIMLVTSMLGLGGTHW
eukprot:CAMPEP_0197454692 /NCGR_PEP_ID=MMETSP1175-20131217/38642_1 /TAXON_ID=1003142 /ORGANISM="Triceratium dubium, Strain CCMP147" /LENGTH=533 /DNA_ID=CAMNT_0042988343 /DNA_START=50 /DNA_END=1651 /DNA_ORIENTATION=+